TYHARYLEILLTGLSTVFQKIDRKAEYENTRYLVVRLLTPGGSLPSLYYCLLGMNIVKYRQLLSLNDLVRQGFQEVVHISDFNCDRDVRRRIEEYIKKTVDSIKNSHERLFEVRRFNRYVSSDDEGRFDPSVLRPLYESGSNRYDFDEDLNHIGVFSARLFHTFDTIFFDLLNGTVAIVGTGRTAIFARTFFEVELERLRTTTDRLDRISLDLVSFPFDQYLKIKQSETGSLPQEKEILQFINDGLTLLVELGDTVGQVLELSRMAPESSGATEPLQPIVLKGKPFPLPLENEVVQSRGFLNNKTIRGALELAVTICFTAGVFLHDWYARMLLGKETTYQDEIQKQVRQLENIASQRILDEIKSKYS
ncbi:hypothetical protein LCGC14_2563390, partial [marine sediment metagenome]